MKHLKLFEEYSQKSDWDKFMDYLTKQDFELYDGEEDLYQKFIEVTVSTDSPEDKSSQIADYLDEKWGLYDGYEYVVDFLTDLFSNNNSTNEGVLKNIIKNSYLVKYQVTNYKALANKHHSNKGKEQETVLDEWDSKIYEYVIKANTSEEAKDKFTKLWKKEAQGLSPAPKLKIVSANETKKNSSDNKINLF